nr:TetR family transcriptional regulator [Gordonia soli]
MPTETRRELLLDAAFRVIARHGVGGATTRTISAEAGVTLSTFHYVFDSRADLLAALVERGTDSELATIAAALDVETGDLRGRAGMSTVLRGALSGYLEGVIADPDREQAMISLNQYARQQEGLESLGADMYRRYYALVADGLSAAATRCAVSWDRPPADLAPLVVAATDGLTLAYLNIRDRGVCERIVDATVTLLLTRVVESSVTEGK